MKYWEIIADNLSKAGRSWGCMSAFTLQRANNLIVDTHPGYGKRFAVRADGILTVFLELERAIYEFAVSLVL